MIRPRQIIRILGLLPLATCAAAWFISYQCAVGLVRVHGDALVVESNRGSIVIVRTLPLFSWFLAPPVAFAQPTPVWSTFHSPSDFADLAEVGLAGYARRLPLGFQFGIRHPPGPSDPDWELDSSGNPVAVPKPAPTTDPGTWTFNYHSPTPAVTSLHFAVAIPWWFPTALAALLAWFIRRKTSRPPNAARAFPVLPPKNP